MLEMTAYWLMDTMFIIWIYILNTSKAGVAAVALSCAELSEIGPHKLLIQSSSK